MSNNSLENYIIALIERRKSELKQLVLDKESTYIIGGVEFSVYTEKDYLNKFHGLSWSIDDLTMCLTAHDNTYNNTL